MEKPNSPLYLTTLKVIANILIRLWLVIGVLMANSILDGLMYQSENPMLQTEVSPEMLDKLTPRQLETISATQTANQLLSIAYKSPASGHAIGLKDCFCTAISFNGDAGTEGGRIKFSATFKTFTII